MFSVHTPSFLSINNSVPGWPRLMDSTLTENTPPGAASSSIMDKVLNIYNSMLFLCTVKKQYEDNQDVCSEFWGILKNFKSGTYVTIIPHVYVSYFLFSLFYI